MGLQRIEMSLPGEASSLNPGLEPPPSKLIWEEDDEVWKVSKILDELNRLEKAPKKLPDSSTHSSFGQIQEVPWLDTITKCHCEDILAAATDSSSNFIFDNDTAPPTLLIDMPTFDVPVMHEETFYATPTHGACGGVSALDLALSRKHEGENHLSLVPFLDYESEQNNPVEDKYRTLAHDLLRGLVDPALKPDREQRDRLAAIIASPSHHPTREEKDLLWRFRFSLVDNRSALTKFLLAVDWEIESEVVQAAELLEQWRKRSPIEVTDALRLLGKHVAFQTNLVSSSQRDDNNLFLHFDLLIIFNFWYTTIFRSVVMQLIPLRLLQTMSYAFICCNLFKLLSTKIQTNQLLQVCTDPSRFLPRPPVQGLRLPIFSLTEQRRTLSSPTFCTGKALI